MISARAIAQFRTKAASEYCESFPASLTAADGTAYSVGCSGVTLSDDLGQGGFRKVRTVRFIFSAAAFDDQGKPKILPKTYLECTAPAHLAGRYLIDTTQPGSGPELLAVNCTAAAQ